MKKKRWRHLNQLTICFVLLLLITFYQNGKKEQLEQKIQNSFVQQVMSISNGSTESSTIEEKRKVYLTFDDGPSKYTEEILKILKEENVKATFFVVGYEGEVYAKRYRAIVEEGHTLAMHAYEHDYGKIYQSVENFSKDLKKLQTLLEDVTGIKPTIYRFPGGSSNSQIKIPIKKFIHYLDEQGITYYDWNALSEDAIYKDLSPEKLNQNILKDLKHKDPCIVLMHDLGDRHGTVEALRPLIRQLKELNCEILPITEATPTIQHVKLKEK